MLINDIDGDVAEQAATEIDGETAVFSGDLTEPDAADKLVAAADRRLRLGRRVVNNAGYTWDGVVHQMSDEQFQAMLDIHTVVPFRVIRALAPHWREAAKAERNEGKEVFRKIVNISSVSGTMGNAGQANYSAAQGGRHRPDEDDGQGVGPVQDQLQRGRLRLRRDAAHRRPGRRARRSRRKSGEKIELGIPEQMREMGKMMIPLGRAAQPEEAAGPVLFLCSDLANYIHGQVINVTGGQFTGMYS